MIGGRHRRENGGITVRALSDRCEWGSRGMYCTLKAGHHGWHYLAHPGTDAVVYLGTDMKVLPQ